MEINKKTIIWIRAVEIYGNDALLERRCYY